MIRALYQKTKSVALQAQQQVREILFPQSMVMMYHRVIDLPFDKQYLAVSPEVFRKQLLKVQESHEIVSLEELQNELQVRKGNRLAAITFDDGFEDNFTIASEILEELKAPATFFVSTDVIDSNRELWTGDLERIFYVSTPEFAKFRITIEGQNCETSDRDTAYLFVKNLFFYLSCERREQARLSLCEQLGISSEGRTNYRFMSSKQLKSLADNALFSIGAHTMSHPKLSLLSREQQKHEITQSKKHLEEWIGQEVKYFAYPFGQLIDYTSTSIELCQEIGFLGAVTAYPGLLDKWTAPFEIPRYNAVSGFPL